MALVILLNLSLTEILLLRNAGWAKDYNLNFSILPLSVITFLLSLHINISFNTEKFREIATTLFYVHIGVYVLVQFILFSGDVTRIRNYGLLAFIITVILSFLLTIFIHQFKKFKFVRYYFM